MGARVKKPKIDSEKEAFREALRLRLKSFHGAMGEMAEAAGASRDKVRRWVNQPGNKFPDLFELYKIAESQGVSPSWLAYGDKDQSPIDSTDRAVLEFLHTNTMAMRVVEAMMSESPGVGSDQEMKGLEKGLRELKRLADSSGDKSLKVRATKKRGRSRPKK